MEFGGSRGGSPPDSRLQGKNSMADSGFTFLPNQPAPSGSSVPVEKPRLRRVVGRTAAFLQSMNIRPMQSRSRLKSSSREPLRSPSINPRKGAFSFSQESKRSMGRSSAEKVQGQRKSNATQHSPVAGTKLLATGRELSQLNSIIVKAIPAQYLNQETLRSHFGSFGNIKRINCNLAKEYAVIHYENHEAAKMAKTLGAKLIPGISVFWSKSAKKLSAEEIGSQEPSSKSSPKEDLEEGEIPEEIPPSKTMKRPHSLERLSRNKKVPSLEVREKPLVTQSIDTKAKNLEQVLTIQTMDLSDRCKVLNARDSLMRQKQEKQHNIYTDSIVVGTCPDMCPEFERYSRTEKNIISVFERKEGEVDPKAMVKEYSRSSADQKEPLPHHLRPIPVLELTMGHILWNVVNRTDISPGEWYDFIWDRTRGIRKDITLQHPCDLASVALIEKCARFHIHCGFALATEEMSSFDPKINNDNLAECFQSLRQLYLDLALHGLKSPSEMEFRGYDILFNLTEGGVLRKIQDFSSEVQSSPEVKFAITVLQCITSNNYLRFFRLVRGAPYLSSCLLHRYFSTVRHRALVTMTKAYTRPNHPELIPLQHLVNLLAFENEQHAHNFCEHLGLMVEGGCVALDRAALNPSPSLYPVLLGYKMVEAKKQATLGEVINGGPLSPNPYHNYIPHDSFDHDGRLRPAAFDASDQIQAAASPRPLSTSSQPESISPPPGPAPKFSFLSPPSQPPKPSPQVPPPKNLPTFSFLQAPASQESAWKTPAAPAPQAFSWKGGASVSHPEPTSVPQWIPRIPTESHPEQAPTSQGFSFKGPQATHPEPTSEPQGFSWKSAPDQAPIPQGFSFKVPPASHPEPPSASQGFSWKSPPPSQDFTWNTAQPPSAAWTSPQSPLSRGFSALLEGKKKKEDTLPSVEVQREVGQLVLDEVISEEATSSAVQEIFLHTVFNDLVEEVVRGVCCQQSQYWGRLSRCGLQLGQQLLEEVVGGMVHSISQEAVLLEKFPPQFLKKLIDEEIKECTYQWLVDARTEHERRKCTIKHRLCRKYFSRWMNLVRQRRRKARALENFPTGPVFAATPRYSPVVPGHVPHTHMESMVRMETNHHLLDVGVKLKKKKETYAALPLPLEKMVLPGKVFKLLVLSPVTDHPAAEWICAKLRCGDPVASDLPPWVEQLSLFKSPTKGTYVSVQYVAGQEVPQNVLWGTSGVFLLAQQVDDIWWAQQLLTPLLPSPALAIFHSGQSQPPTFRLSLDLFEDTLELAKAVHWVVTNQTPLPSLQVSPLKVLVQDVFSELVFGELASASPHIELAAILALYNSTAKYLATVLTSPTLHTLTWPPPELELLSPSVEEEGIPQPGWNTPARLSQVQAILLGLQVPCWESQEDPLGFVRSLASTQPLLAAPLLRERVKQILARSSSSVPWREILEECFNSLLDTVCWKDQEGVPLQAYYLAQELASFKAPPEWNLAVRKALLYPKQTITHPHPPRGIRQPSSPPSLLPQVKNTKTPLQHQNEVKARMLSEQLLQEQQQSEEYLALLQQLVEEGLQPLPSYHP